MESRRTLEAAQTRVLGAAQKLLGGARGMPAVLRRIPRVAGGLPGAARWAWTSVRRRWQMAIAIACVASMTAGITIVALPTSNGPPPNAGIFAPGSQGSLSHHRWWDPAGWFGGNGAPSSHTLADATLALPSHSRMPRQAVAPPVHRVAELTSKRSQYSKTYLLSNGQREAVISTVPVNYRTSSDRWAPISTQLTRSTLAGYAFQNTTNTFSSYFGSKPGQ